MPVPRARVVAVREAGSDETLADESGVARMARSVAGAAALWVHASGWASARIPRPSADPSGLDVVLTRGARVRIRWRTEAGAPIDDEEILRSLGARASAVVLDASVAEGVSWSDVGSPLRSPRASWQFETPIVWEEDGARLEASLPAGIWRVVVPRPASVPALVPVTVGAEDREMILSVAADASAATRRVRVLDDRGEPVAGARLTPWLALVRDFAWAPGAALVADGEGVAVLPRSARGGPRPVWVVTSATHAGEIDASVLETRADQDPLAVRIRPAARIEGVAFASPGVPAARAAVSWTSRAGPSVRAVCDAEGRFVLEGIALRRGAEEAVPLAVGVGDGTRFHAVQAAAGRTTQVVLGLADPAAPAGRVEGRLTAGGAPLAGVQVVLAPASDPRALLSMATGTDGSFTFEAVPAGVARLRIVCGDPRVSDAARIVSAVPFPVEAGQVIRLDHDLPDAAIRVVVVDAASGSPLPAVRVVARPLEDGGLGGRFPGATFAPGWSAITDASGSALLTGLVPVARHRIEALDASGRAAEVGEATPGTVAAPSTVRIVLRDPP